MPWRKSTDPYKIWLSEIILQQTRVAQGMPYYQKFVDNFPTIKDLANAKEEKVLQLWQGLGYYSRGRNLHFTAKKITHELSGIFPSTYESIEKLKGVGKYTAAAIASFSFNEKVAVLDGNVMRVLTRYFGINNDISSSKTVNELRELANSLLPSKEHSNYNQGIMEFGALQCTPKKPDCNNCPLNNNCEAFNKDIVNQLPVKLKKVKVRKRYFNYIVLKQNSEILLNQRVKKDIWQNLYDFPLLESEALLTVKDENIVNFMKEITLENEFTISVSEDFKHILSHQIIHARFFLIELNQEIKIDFSNGMLMKINQLDDVGKPILIQNYLNKYIF